MFVEFLRGKGSRLIAWYALDFDLYLQFLLFLINLFRLFEFHIIDIDKPGSLLFAVLFLFLFPRLCFAVFILITFTNRKSI